MENLTIAQKEKGYSFELNKTNEYLQDLCNAKQLAITRPRFLVALQVERKLVWAQYSSYYLDNIGNRDFDGSKNAFEMADIDAMDEAIDFAEKLEERDLRFCSEDERPHRLMQFS